LADGTEFSLNFASQHQKSFLLDIPAPARARFFHNLAGSEILETAAQKGRRAASVAKSEYAKMEQEVTELRKEIDQKNAKLVELDDCLSEAENAKSIYLESQSELDRMMALLNALSDALEALREAQRVPDGIRHDLAEADRLYGILEGKSEKLSIANRAINRMSSAKSHVSNVLQQIETAENRISTIEKEIRVHLKTGKPCPFSGEALPQICVGALAG
jgi:DNA repair ATPase RecN